MALQPNQCTDLWDRQGRKLGRVVLGRIEGDLVFGQFVPAAEFAQVEHLFAEYVEAANQQLLSIVGELDAAITRLGLQLRSLDGDGLPAIRDVQIGEGIITFRIQSHGDKLEQQDGTTNSAARAPVLDSI